MTGLKEARQANRNAYAGLQNAWGTVTLGRHQTLFYDYGIIYDPMVIAARYSVISIAPEFASRADNAIRYTGTFGGLNLAAMYAFNNNGAEIPGAYTAGREISATVRYDAGPLSIGTTYDQTNGNTIATSDQMLRRASIASTY